MPVYRWIENNKVKIVDKTHINQRPTSLLFIFDLQTWTNRAFLMHSVLKMWGIVLK